MLDDLFVEETHEAEPAELFWDEKHLTGQLVLFKSTVDERVELGEEGSHLL